MNKKLFLVLAVIFSQITIFANTGWSGKVTEGDLLDTLVVEKIQALYISNCLKLKNKSFSINPIVEVSRVNDEYDYLGSYAPTYEVNIKVYNPRIFDFETQQIMVEVLYNQLSQELTLKILDDAKLECHN